MDPATSTFEQQLAELEGVVNELERGDIGLEMALSQYERGISLLKRCHEALRKAELRIERLTGVDAAGNPEVEPFSSTSAVGEGSSPPTKKSRKKGTTSETKESELDRESGLF